MTWPTGWCLKCISRNYIVWPIFFLMNVFIALKGTQFLFLFAFTAAGVVQCGSRKTSPRTSTIVQFIYLFIGPWRSAWTFWEIRNKCLIQTRILDRFLIYRTPFDLYQSLNRLLIWNSQNCSIFPLVFVAGWLQGHWWDFISRNYIVWPIFFLMNVFIALKGTHFLFLFAFTAAGVVKCDGRKTSPPTSTIVQFILFYYYYFFFFFFFFFFLSFEISVNILRNQK